MSLFERTELNNFKKQIERYLNFPLSICITDNMTSMIRVKREKGRVLLRIHWMFLKSEDEVKRAVAEFIAKRSKESIEILRRFIKGFPLPERKLRKAASSREKGKFVNLRQIFDEVNREYFAGRIKSQITFGRYIHKRRKSRFINLGYYREDIDTIYISTRLDRIGIPEVFIKFIVYHEMLHAMEKESETECCRRRRRHSKSFREKEKMFKEYFLVQKIKKKIIGML